MINIGKHRIGLKGKYRLDMYVGRVWGICGIILFEQPTKPAYVYGCKRPPWI